MKFKYYEKMLTAAGFTVHHALNTLQWLNFINQTKHIDAVMVDASVLEQASDIEISQINSVRSGLPMVVFGGKDSQIQTLNYVELDEPVSFDELMDVVGKFVG